MYARVILSGFLVFVFVAEATAQRRIRWRPGAILEGLADTVQEVARDTRYRETSTAPAEDSADGLIGGQNNRAYPQHPDLSHHARHRPTLGHQKRATWLSSQQTTRAVSIDDVIKMVQRGLGESTIVQYLGDNGMKQHLNVSDLLRLHEEGVSEPIINAMQKAQVFYAETGPSPVLLGTKSHSLRSDTRFIKPSVRTLDIEQFGPSILTLQQRPAVATPAPNSKPTE